MSAANRVLFDEPGPRGRRRIAVTSVLTAVVLLALLALALRQFAAHGQLEAERWTQFTERPVLRFLAKGMVGTLKAAAVAAVVSVPLGAVFTLLRLSRVRIVRWLGTAYIEVFRSVPMLLLIYLFIGGLPAVGLNLPIFWKLVVPMILGNVAILAEVFRAGVTAVPRGQSEAGSSIGLTHRQNMRTVVFPQALRLVVPALVTQVVALLKDTTLGYAASYPELMQTATNLTSYTRFLIQTYLVIALVYVAVNYLISQVAVWLERRTGVSTTGMDRVVRGATQPTQ